jgi:hypothetical protein
LIEAIQKKGHLEIGYVVPASAFRGTVSRVFTVTRQVQMVEVMVSQLILQIVSIMPVIQKDQLLLLQQEMKTQVQEVILLVMME